MNRVVLVTGASSGIGQATALELLRDGYRVYGASRHPETAPAGDYTKIKIDVTDDVSVTTALAQIIQREGGLDAVVASAGFSMLGSVEDTPLEDARDIFETNYWGVVRIVRAVLPVMRRRGGGHIVVISSVGGRVAVPFRAFYSSTKFALEAFCEALSLEVAVQGIQVSLVAPGHVSTNLRTNRRKIAATLDNPAYGAVYARCVDAIEQQDRHGSAAETVAHLVARIIREPSPKLRYTVGTPTERFSILARNLLPDRFFRRLVLRHYRPR